MDARTRAFWLHIIRLAKGMLRAAEEYVAPPDKAAPTNGDAK